MAIQNQPQSQQNNPASHQTSQSTKPKKGCCTCLNCFLAVLIFFFVSFLVITSLAAASGIFKVPLLSRIFYHEPALKNIYPPLSSEEFQKKTESAFAKNKMPPKTITLTFTSAEASGYLTGVVSETAKKTNAPHIDKADVQIKKDDLSVLIEIYNPAFTKSLFLRDRIWFEGDILPQIDNSRIDFTIRKIKIGNLRIPAFGFNLIKSYILKTIPQTTEMTENIKLYDGRLEVTTDSSMFMNDFSN